MISLTSLTSSTSSLLSENDIETQQQQEQQQEKQQEKQQNRNGNNDGNDFHKKQYQQQSTVSYHYRISKYIIDTIQSIRVPILLVQCCYCTRNRLQQSYYTYRKGIVKRQDDDDDDNDNSDIDNNTIENVNMISNITTVTVTEKQTVLSNNTNTTIVYCISGLEKVFFYQTSCVDAPVIFCNIIQLPKYGWYMISGGICDIVQFIISYILYTVFNITNPTYCWILSFILSIIVRHTIHKYILFGGNYINGYYNSLYRMYSAYSIIIIISTLLNALLTMILYNNNDNNHNNHNNKNHITIIFFLTMTLSGIINYFILNKVWYCNITSTTNGSSTTTSTNG